MQPTAPPWAAWWRVYRREPYREERWRPRLGVYTIAARRPERPARRFGSGFDPYFGFPTPANPWLRGRHPVDSDGWIPLLPEWKSVSSERAPLPAAAPPLNPATAPAAGSAGDEATGVGGGGAALGWAAGTVMLALFVLLVRAAEKCLDRRLFKSRRRQSDEWPTPNVIATSNAHTSQTDIGLPPRLEAEPYPSGSRSTIDLPPPYSECASVGPNTIDIGAKPSSDEPPPPYSACYVAFSNPKDGIPSVHFFGRREIGNEGENNDVLVHNTVEVVNDGMDQRNDNAPVNGHVVDTDEVNGHVISYNESDNPRDRNLVV